jgi:hypothetical protein
MMPLERSERHALAETLRNTLRYLDDVTLPGASMECETRPHS